MPNHGFHGYWPIKPLSGLFFSMKNIFLVCVTSGRNAIQYQIVTEKLLAIKVSLAKKQIYLQRVNKLYADIKNWLQDEPFVDEPFVLEENNINVVEILGKYQALQWSIKTQAGELLAEFQPTGVWVGKLVGQKTINDIAILGSIRTLAFSLFVHIELIHALSIALLPFF